MMEKGIRIAAVFALLAACLSLFGPRAGAAEAPAGLPLKKNGLEVMAVYLQPVKMDWETKAEDPANCDIHLEADIHAGKGNAEGFPIEAWIPYLRVRYTLTKKGSSWRAQGLLYPMVANDGPHYGANLKLDGPGAYALLLRIAPPTPQQFMRHIDKETGVAPWWAPFTYKGGFNFVGTGKKGGY